MKTSHTHEDAQNMIGDGQLPNIYFVTTSRDYTVHPADDTPNHPAVDKYTDLDPDNSFVGAFTTFKEARNAVDETFMPSPEDQWEGAHSIYIEDRLTGVVYEIQWHEYHTVTKFGSTYTFEVEAYDDSQFTREKLGDKFE